MNQLFEDVATNKNLIKCPTNVRDCLSSLDRLTDGVVPLDELRTVKHTAEYIYALNLCILCLYYE